MSEERPRSKSRSPAAAASSRATVSTTEPLPVVVATEGLGPESLAVQQAQDEERSLAETISRQLRELTYECANCLEVIRHAVATWGCRNCFRVFHLFCIKKWAQQEGSGVGTTFRCPHCQAQQISVNKYYCFCGKVVDPPSDPYITPHSCGDTCGRARAHGCPHRCTQMCHPGPCPDCQVTTPEKHCPCGKTTYSHRCGKPDPLTTCTNTCDKLLECGAHRCSKVCHQGPCDTVCSVLEDVSCRCGKVTKKVLCGTAIFGCDQPCGRLQRCGKHNCDTLCHSGACPPCDYDPALVVTCPCGKMAVDPATRSSCVDPVPLCGEVCGKVLPCGNHYCDLKCHTGRCGECKNKILTRCACGSNSAKVLCRDAASYKCTKRCKAKMSCGKHECEVICCPDRTASAPNCPAHTCSRPCQKKLSPCGHACAERCHRGNCPPCANIITNIMYCNCGFEILMPPQPCSTPPPSCSRPCTREAACGHPVARHNCHYGDCPPCAAPVQRRCAGGHTTLSNVLCSAPPVSCGQECGLALECGHTCIRKCHIGPCMVDTAKARCTQVCGRVMPECGHPCQAKCHPSSAECPKCTFQQEIQCECGNLKQKLSCTAYMNRLDKHLSSGRDRRYLLECTSDCFFQQRLSALKSVSGGVTTSGAAVSSSKRIVLFSTRLWNVAVKNIDAVKGIETTFAEFIKSKENTLLLPPMLRERRAIVHELALFYHIHCEAVDEEPKRSCFLSKTMATAVPSLLLSAAIYRDENNPMDFAERALSSHEEMRKRVIQFEGDKLNEITVHHSLKAVMGTFVVVQAQGAFLGPPSSPAVPSTLVKFFAIFPTSVERQHAFVVLRKHGCPVLYHLFGEAPPPKRFIWEPDRSGATAELVVPTLEVPHRSAARHADPSQPASSSPASSWSSVIAPKRETAKERKQHEKSHVETSNMFSALHK